jgi:predicted protein tyrosine phosphatase
MVDNISCIYKQLYISNHQQACNIDLLKQNNITVILHLGSSKKSRKILLEYKKNNIHHKFIKIFDIYNTDIYPCCNNACKFINKFIKHGDNILIHCKMGISRSPTIVAYYLMYLMYEYMKKKQIVHPVLNEIVDLIRINRPCIRPNKSFITQLKLFEKKELYIYENNLLYCSSYLSLTRELSSTNNNKH